MTGKTAGRKPEPTFARFTPEEQVQVEAIVGRAVAMYRSFGVRRRPLEIRMDLSAVHARCPLRLADLAMADDFNFSHDIGGIAKHLNRETGDLGDFFVPRFAVAHAGGEA